MKTKQQINREFFESLRTEAILNSIGLTKYYDNKYLQYITNVTRQENLNLGLIELELLILDEERQMKVRYDKIEYCILQEFTSYKFHVSVAAMDKFAGHQPVKINIKIDDSCYETHRTMPYHEVRKIKQSLHSLGFNDSDIKRFVELYQLYN